MSRGGLVSDGSAVGNVRRRELMGRRRSLRRRRGKVDALAGGVVLVGRELVLGGNEGEKALLEARGADAIAVLVRVDLALHPEATVITGVAQLLPCGPPRPPHLSAPAIQGAARQREKGEKSPLTSSVYLPERVHLNMEPLCLI